MNNSAFPKYLYRGDDDSKDTRLLRSTIKYNYIMTNLCRGGSGKAIFTTPLKELVNRHVAIGWNETHFLSFSENEEIAFNYGSQNKESEEIYDSNANWDFAVLTLDTSLFIQDKIVEIEKGVYTACYYPSCKEFLPLFNLLLVDSISYLKNLNYVDSHTNTSIKNAERDSEWLILPMSPFEHGEYKAKLDGNCLSNKRFYDII